MNVKNKFLTLNAMQAHFPSIGCYFRVGAVPPAVAQIFIRSVPTKTEIKLPLICPGLEELEGTVPPSSLLLDNWVFGSDLGKRIYDDVMAMDSKSLFASCHDMFYKHENCPVLIKDADHRLQGIGHIFSRRSLPPVECSLNCRVESAPRKGHRKP